MVYWGSMMDTMGNMVWSMVDSLVDKGSMVDRSMVENGGMVGSMVDTMGNMLGSMVKSVMGSMVDIVVRSMMGSLVDSMMGAMETSMVDGGNNRMGSVVTTVGSMSNSVNSEAIFVDGLMAMLGWGS